MIAKASVKSITISSGILKNLNNNSQSRAAIDFSVTRD